MNKLSVIILLLLTGYALPANAQLRVETGVNQGYEWNIFKNPERLVEDTDTLQRNQLWQNSVYNEIYLESDYYKDWGENRLKLSADVGTDLYYQQSQAHRFNYRLLSSFRSNFIDNVYIELAPEFEREQQDGIDRTDLVFSTRLSYHQLEAPLHLDFYLGNKAWLKFEGQYRYKIYDEFERTKKYILRLSGANELMEEKPVDKESIQMRQRIELPLVTIQQYALTKIREIEQSGGDEDMKEVYEKLVIRCSFGIINAERNSA